MKPANSKLNVALKRYKTSMKEKSNSYEQIYRTHLLYELSKLKTKNKTKINLGELQKKFPSECLMHPIKPRTKMEPREKMFAEKVDSLFYDNEMFSTERRADLLRTYHHISSCYHIFSDFVKEKNLKFNQFTENASNLIRVNTNLNERIIDHLLHEETEVELTKIKPDVTPEVLRTQDIHDIKKAQYNSLKQRFRMNQLSSLHNTINYDSSDDEDVIETAISGRTSRSVSSRCSSSKEVAIEKDQIIAELEEISNVEFDDIGTMKSELMDLEQEKRVLLDRRNKAQSKINLSKRSKATKINFSKTEPDNLYGTQLNAFTSIAARNETKLCQVLAENEELQRQIDQILQKRKTETMF